MNFLQDRRLLIAAGAAAAVLAAVLIGAFLAVQDRPAEVANVDSNAELHIELGEQAKLDPDRQLRCFVGGQFIGTATLAECAKRNGVAAQSLDVGLDPSGSLAAGGESLAPIPKLSAPAQVAIDSPPPAVRPAAPLPVGAPTAPCMQYGPDGWRATGGSLSLSACVQTLFAGRCPRQGEALYGRWSGQTLRVVPGRVEASGDNKDFHGLAEQGRDCSIPPL